MVISQICRFLEFHIIISSRVIASCRICILAFCTDAFPAFVFSERLRNVLICDLAVLYAHLIAEQSTYLVARSATLASRYRSFVALLHYRIVFRCESHGFASFLCFASLCCDIIYATWLSVYPSMIFPHLQTSFFTKIPTLPHLWKSF